MSTKINDDSMSLEIDGRVIATAQFRVHAVADGHAPGSSRVTRGACAPGARRSRPWCSQSGSPPGTAMMTFVVGWRAELDPYTCAVDLPGSPGHEVRLCCCERVPQMYPPLVGGRVGGEDVYVRWPLISKCPGLDECTTQ